METSRITDLRERQEQIETHLVEKLLPFWVEHAPDRRHGGYVTHFDQDGNGTGEDEKSLIAQTRTVYTFSSALRAGYGGQPLAKLARHGVDFLVDRMWDGEHGGFYWTTDRSGKVVIDKKILYGHSFAMYALAEYTLATGDKRGLEYAEMVFDLTKKYCADTMYGGFFEMHERNWDLCGTGAQGGDRKTLDAHMHLMEAFTTLYECSGKSVHERTLRETIENLTTRILHPTYRTGVPQFWADWSVAPQIKFDIVWGWDRFGDGGVKDNGEDNTSAGHNVEFAWLLWRALDVMKRDWEPYRTLLKTQLDHALLNGIDSEFGGVYVEGPHSGGVSDMEKEFWQQVEVMIGMLEGYLRFGDEAYLDAYANVHGFLFSKGINKSTGELWPLLSREGTPIWTHTSHSWKVNYHSVRGLIQCAERLGRIVG